MTPVGEARRRCCGTRVGGVDGEGFFGAAGGSLGADVGRRRDDVGIWAPVLKVVQWRRRWPWRDFGSVRLRWLVLR